MFRALVAHHQRVRSFKNSRPTHVLKNWIITHDMENVNKIKTLQNNGTTQHVSDHSIHRQEYRIEISGTRDWYFDISIPDKV